MEKPTLDELCRGYKEIYPAAITDILDEMGLKNQWLGPEIKPLHIEMKAAGPAFTMRWVNDPEPLGEEGKKYIAGLSNALGPHMIPVIDSAKCPNSGYWGELMCTLCNRVGIEGAVIDGGVRDAYYVYKAGFNMFAAFVCPLEAATRSRLESYQKPIFINNVLIRPGDFIVAEFGGVIVIPQEIVYEVYERVQAVLARETNTRRMIREGYSMDEIVKQGGL